MMNDRSQILSKLSSMPKVVLDLGCGPGKKNPEWIGIDMLDYPGVDIVGDVYSIVGAFPDASVDEVHAYHFFEHLPDVPLLLRELQRVLKPTGFINIVVPHFSNAYFYSDYTHKNFFGLYSMSYLVRDRRFRRGVPNYQVDIALELADVKLYFKSPIIINRIPRAIWQLIFNAGVFMQEWYEDSWSRTFPCYEIQYILRKVS